VFERNLWLFARNVRVTHSTNEEDKSVAGPPAMSDHVWDITEIVDLLDSSARIAA